jgi:hypothetical protein
MHRDSREAVRMITDVHWAGVTAQFAGPPFTAAHTDTRVLIVDEGQYGQGDGPCLQAMRTDRVVTMTSEDVSEQWPILAAAVAEAGVRAFHAEPLHVRHQSVGSLNLYSGHPGGLDTPDPDVLTVLTEYLDQGLTDFSAAQPGEPDARRLQDLIHARFLINQAVGMVWPVKASAPTQPANNSTRTPPSKAGRSPISPNTSSAAAPTDPGRRIQRRRQCKRPQVTTNVAAVQHS